jgi:hypothetical protein
MANEIFIDWISISQLHETDEFFPIYCGGIVVNYDAIGRARHERVCAATFPGSHETSIRLKSDGKHISLSGNVGRFSRKDNLFNLGWSETLSKTNRILLDKGLPPFSPGKFFNSFNQSDSRGARVSRLDITCNFATGSESQARSLIRWLANRSVSRMKKGRAGDESVWWVNTRHMLKAYIKHIEMLKHGCAEDDPVYQWCKEQGVVRVEIELKKRLLHDEGLNKLENITDEKLIAIFESETEIFRRVDRSDEPDILDAIPAKSRIYAAAWFAGKDLVDLASRATLFRHAKILRDYGIDIMEPRNIEQFPVKVQIVDLKPLSMPDWYSLEDEKPRLRVVGE